MRGSGLKAEGLTSFLQGILSNFFLGPEKAGQPDLSLIHGPLLLRGVTFQPSNGTFLSTESQGSAQQIPGITAGVQVPRQPVLSRPHHFQNPLPLLRT